ncbi:MAG: 50S ribosomal protein L29 [Ignavibacteriales bacterium]|jgi:large subunit ribosomal protein L29
MKSGEIRELKDDELKRKGRDIREEIFNLRVQLSTRQATNFGRIKKLKKDLARVLTIQREREFGMRK